MARSQKKLNRHGSVRIGQAFAPVIEVWLAFYHPMSSCRPEAAPLRPFITIGFGCVRGFCLVRGSLRLAGPASRSPSTREEIRGGALLWRRDLHSIRPHTTISCYNANAVCGAVCQTLFSNARPQRVFSRWAAKSAHTFHFWQASLKSWRSCGAFGERP